MRKIKDLCVVTRSYTKNGQDKNVWKNVGGVFVNDDGNERYAIDPFFNFAALQRQENTDRVWLYAFPVKQKDSNQNSSLREDYPLPYDERKGFDRNATLGNDDVPF